MFPKDRVQYYMEEYEVTEDFLMKRILISLFVLALTLVLFLSACQRDLPANDKDLPKTDRTSIDEPAESVEKPIESDQVTRPLTPARSLDEITNWTFSSVDLDGHPVDESIFSEATLTMVNIWATWCGPCRIEIPDIGHLANNEFKELNVQVLGIVTDVELNENHEIELAIAKQILADAGVSYLNVKFNYKNMNDSLFKFVQAFPTTIFVDSHGNVVGPEIVGTRSKDAFLEEAQARLAMLND